MGKTRGLMEKIAQASNPRPSKGKKGFFFVIWQMSLLEVEEKGLRRPPTPLEAFKHHLASQPRIFVEQMLKVCAFYPLFFYLFHGLFERFLAYFFAICFYYFAIDFHAPKNEKQSQCKWGF